MSRNRVRILASPRACLAGALARDRWLAQVRVAGGLSTGTCTPAAVEAGDWPKYCGDLLMSGVAAGEVALSPASVPALDLLWSRSLSGPVASSPTVAGGRVFVGDWSGREWAFEAATGNLVATADLGQTVAPQCNPGAIGITSAAAAARGLLFLAGGDDGFYALDPATLSVVWRVSLGDNSENGRLLRLVLPRDLGRRRPAGRFEQLRQSVHAGPARRARRRDREDRGGRGLHASRGERERRLDVAGRRRRARKVFVTTASATISRTVTHSRSSASTSTPSRSRTSGAIDQPLAVPRPTTTGAPRRRCSRTRPARRLVGAGQKDGSYYAFDRANITAGPVWSTPICRDGAIPQYGEGSLSTAAFDGTRLYMGGGAPLDYERPERSRHADGPRPGRRTCRLAPDLRRPGDRADRVRERRRLFDGRQARGSPSTRPPARSSGPSRRGVPASAASPSRGAASTSETSPAGSTASAFPS